MQTAEVWVSFAPLCSLRFHPQMFVVFKLLMVLTKAWEKVKAHGWERDNCKLYILCFEILTPLLCLSWQLQVKDLKFPITAGRNAKGSRTRKSNFLSEGVFCEEGHLLFLQHCIPFEYAILVKSPCGENQAFNAVYMSVVFLICFKTNQIHTSTPLLGVFSSKLQWTKNTVWNPWCFWRHKLPFNQSAS